MAQISPQKLGRFRWLILLSCSACGALTWGTLYGVGVLYSCWSRDFPQSSEAFISLVGALPVAIACGLGPIYGMIIRKHGYRKSVIYGGIIMSIGWAISGFMSSMQGLLITFGLITGFGAGLANFAAGTAMNDYYIKDRVVAEGLFGSSVCLTMFIVTEILQKLTEIYTWQGAMMIFGAFHLHLCICGIVLIRPDQALTHPFLTCMNGGSKKYTTSQDTIEGTTTQLKLVEDHNGNIGEKQLEMEAEEEECSEKSKEQQEGRTLVDFIRVTIETWRRPCFAFLIVSDTLSWMATFVPYVHLIERARVLGVDDDTSAWISSCIGISGVVGRFFLAYLFQKIKIHPLYSYGIIQVCSGLVTIISPFWSTIEGLFVYAILFGFFSGGYGFIKASVALMLGREVYAISFSWFLLLEGFGIAFGPTIGGLLYKRTQSYTWTFIFSGSLIFVSGVMCVCKDMVLKWDRKSDMKNKKLKTISALEMKT